MFLYYFSITLAILSLVLYHISQKSVAPSVHPLISLIVIYLVALGTTLALLPFFPLRENFFSSFKHINWASFGVGLAIVGAEVGFLLVYRAGWNISLAALLSNIMVALILIPIGLFVFSEKLSSSQILGIVLAFIALVLMSYK